MCRVRNLKEYNSKKELVKNIFTKSEGTFGTRRIVSIMRKNGLKSSRKTVREIMKANNLIAIDKKEYLVKTPIKNYFKPIKENIYIDEKPKTICEKWTVDDTRFAINNKIYFLITVIDDYSRRVVSYNLCNNLKVLEITDTIMKAYENRRPMKKLVLHFDNDNIYFDPCFIEWKNKWASHFLYSHSPIIESPHYNAHHEAFNATFKKECINAYLHRKKINFNHDLDEDLDLRQFIKNFIYKYNNIRPHSSLKYLSPIEFENKLFVNNKSSIVLHIDYNNFYASCEMLLNRNLINKPLAVAAPNSFDKNIIVSTNYIAKKYGVKCGDYVGYGKFKCKDLIIIRSPHTRFYEKMSNKALEIYKKYTDRISRLGIDECFLDITSSIKLFGNPIDLTYKIQKEVYEATGLTTSLGLSFNTDFAKIASDCIKPHGVTLIPYESRNNICDNLPADIMLDVGEKRYEMLKKENVITFYDLRCARVNLLKKIFGPNLGRKIKFRANGNTLYKVKHVDYIDLKKSKSISSYPSDTIYSNEEVKSLLYIFADRCHTMLKKNNSLGKTFSLTFWCLNKKIPIKISRSYTTSIYTDNTYFICKIFEKIYKNFKNENKKLNVNIRRISFKIENLEDKNYVKSIAKNKNIKLKSNNLIKLMYADAFIDDVKEKFGEDSIKRCVELIPEWEYRRKQGLDFEEG